MGKKNAWTALEQAKAVAARAEEKRRDASIPSLQLLVYGSRTGIRLFARVQVLGPDGQWHLREIATAQWRPERVTERLVVEWGQKALARWLADNPDENLRPESER